MESAISTSGDQPIKDRWELALELRAVRMGWLKNEQLEECMRGLLEMANNPKAAPRTRAKCQKAVMDFVSKQEDCQIAMMALRRKDDDLESREKERALRHEELQVKREEIEADREKARLGALPPAVQVNVSGDSVDMKYEEIVSRVMEKSGLPPPRPKDEG